MQRKLLIHVVLLYIALMASILAIGLSYQQRENLQGAKTGVSHDEKPSEIVEAVSRFSETSVEYSGEQFPSKTPYLESEVLRTQTTEPTITPVLEGLSQLSQTPETTPTTITLPAYPSIVETTALPTWTGTPSQNPEETRIPTNVLTTDPSPTITSVSQTGWNGEWVVFWEQQDGSFLSGIMNVYVEKYNLTAAVSLGQVDYHLEGILNESQIIAVGSWFGSGGSGNFYWRTNALEQFVGNFDREFGFCGARAENNMPDPCLEAPTNK
jgi:hypothetical protein